jgi:SPP1 family predicted phage head-tail adaptor
MKIGDLDHKIEIQTLTTTTDSFGQRIESWGHSPKVWAKRFDRVAAEQLVGDQIVTVLRTEFTIRYKSGFDTTSRVVCHNQVFRIDGIVEMGRKRWLKLICSAHGE